MRIQAALPGTAAIDELAPEAEAWTHPSHQTNVTPITPLLFLWTSQPLDAMASQNIPSSAYATLRRLVVQLGGIVPAFHASRFHASRFHPSRFHPSRFHLSTPRWPTAADCRRGSPSRSSLFENC
eukprot:366305-Chlamydomonas_euryale.AAC.8